MKYLLIQAEQEANPHFSWTLCQFGCDYLTTAYSTNCRWCQNLHNVHQRSAQAALSSAVFWQQT